MLARFALLPLRTSATSSSFLFTPTRAFSEEDSIQEWFTLMKNNREWSKETQAQDPEYFKALSGEQKPPFLYIGCSDSRLPLTNFTKGGPGQFFVHRNIANQVSMTDINLLSTMEYAVTVLKVRHIIVGGHHGCGGIKAAVEGTTSGTIGNWVQPVRRMYLKNRDRLGKMDRKECWDELTEMNVVAQVKNLLTTKVMMETLFKEPKEQVPTVHGVVINISEGLIEEIPMPFDHWKERGILPAHFNNNGYIVGDPALKDNLQNMRFWMSRQAKLFQLELEQTQTIADINDLNQQVALLTGECNELSSLGQGRKVYMQQGNLFFLADGPKVQTAKKRDVITKGQQVEQEKGKLRQIQEKVKEVKGAQ